MSLRARILTGSLVLVAVPVLLLGLGVRREMSRRVTRQYTERVDALMEVVAADLQARGLELGDRLEALAARTADDNRFRLAAVDGLESQRTYLIDYAEPLMRIMGLSLLQIQDEEGRILSSGHFRNEYGRMEPSLPWFLGEAPESTALVRARRAEGDFIALASVVELVLAGRPFHLIGGVAVDRRFLATLVPDPELTLALEHPLGRIALGPRDQASPAASRFVRTLDYPFVMTERDAGQQLAPARIVITHPEEPLRRLLRSLDLWIAAVLAVVLLGAVALAAWVSGRISRPITRLARETEALDLERLDAVFATDRDDEVGVLARGLGALTDRLRAGRENLRDAERRATRGEMSRQVNHDIRNGLTPIRNVLRHLRQVAAEEPARLEPAFNERAGDLEAGITYLEDLASNYARLSTGTVRRRLDANEIARAVSAAHEGRTAVTVRAETAPDLPPILADPVALRRIVENLVRNAVESLGEAGGEVTVRTRAVHDEEGSAAVIEVEDTGCGMSEDDLDRVFEDFFTTKPGGAGLGLSIVRRLTADLDGGVRVTSRPGEGTRFTLRFPVAAAPEEAPPAAAPDHGFPGDGS